MPFVTITLLEGKGKEYIKAVTYGVNSAVIETMGFPDDDRYQVVHQVSEECLQYQNRTSDRVMMHLVMRAGRSNKSKQAFYKKVVQNLSKSVRTCVKMEPKVCQKGAKASQRDPKRSHLEKYRFLMLHRGCVDLVARPFWHQNPLKMQ